MSFPTGVSGKLKTIGEAAAMGGHSSLRNYHDPRLLFAGAQWLHENPQADQREHAYRIIVEQIIDKGKNQFRMRGEPLPTKAAVEAELEPLLDADRRSGRELQAFLRKFRKNGE
jgi:hypothetical protein